MHRDVAAIIDRLRSIIRSAEELILHVEDLHVVAFDRQVADEEKVAGAADHNPLPGNPDARRIYNRLSSRVRDADDLLAGFRAVVLNHLNVGNQNPERWGTHISAADYARALRAQRRRDERGEYTPTPNIPQPKYPGKSPKEKR